MRERRIPSTPGARHDSAEAGSAYLVALFVMVVLGILALSLAMISDTEMLIGDNERQINKAFFAANSGIGFMAGKILLGAEVDGELVVLEPAAVGTVVRSEVLVEEAELLLDLPCNLCAVQAGSGYEAPEYSRRIFRVAATGRRASADDPTDGFEKGGLESEQPGALGPEILARRGVSAFLDVQPIPGTAAAYRTSDEIDMKYIGP